MVIVCGFGNPLLDCIVRINDVELLQKYNLNEDDAKEISSNTLQELLNDIKNRYKLTLIPGGCTQNTLRLIKWLLKKEHQVVMFGAIGEDENGTLLKNLVEQSGVETRYDISNESTGLIISLVHKQNRSLVGNIGAAGFYSVTHLERNQALLKSTGLIYIEAFFLSHGTETASRLLNFFTDNRIKLAFNICAPYIIENKTDLVKEYTEHSSVIFGNLREFTVLAQNLHEDENVEGLLKHLIRDNPDKYVIVTDGCDEITCAYNGGEIIWFKPPALDKTEVVDTTGAGDSFVAGFLAAHLLNRPVVECLRAGCLTAQQVIKMIGCKPPDVEAKEQFWC